MTVGERIKDRLRAKGLSQAELARRVGVSQQMVNGIIRGSSRSTLKLHYFARELGTTVEYLSGEIDDPHLGAPQQLILSADQAKWLEIYNKLSSHNRAALMHVCLEIIKGCS